ncbi:E3 ubiquitin-protein ligase MARCH6 [Cryptococcus neoformans Ze90-1]|nr:E3 ubiquitin-protein ligase MARCH6 [Cryptococcus neoformans var. grubii Ze90-1]
MAEDINIFGDEEGDVCRVCRLGEEPDNPLVYPCKCSGSVRFVHPDCLKQWVAQSQKKHCEICGHKYTFTKVYPKELPTVIPTTVYLRQGLLFLRRQILWVLRAWLVVIVWLVILPAWNIGALFFMSLLSDLIGLKASSGEETIDSTTNATIVESAVASNATAYTPSSVSFPSFIASPFLYANNIVRSSFQKWLQGEENTAVGFVLRGQILSLSMAAVLIGLVLLREWVHQHNWQEAEQPPRHIEPEPNPDEWFILHGVARRQADVISRVLEATRTRAPLSLRTARRNFPPADVPGEALGDEAGNDDDNDVGEDASERLMIGAGQELNEEWWERQRTWANGLPAEHRGTFHEILTSLQATADAAQKAELEGQNQDVPPAQIQADNPLFHKPGMPIADIPKEDLENLQAGSQIHILPSQQGIPPRIWVEVPQEKQGQAEIGNDRPDEQESGGASSEASKLGESMAFDALAEYRRFHALREQQAAVTLDSADDNDDEVQARAGPSRPAWSRRTTVIDDEEKEERDRVAYSAPELLKEDEVEDKGNGKGKAPATDDDVEDKEEETAFGRTGAPWKPLFDPRESDDDSPQPKTEEEDGDEGDNDGDGEWEDEPDARPNPFNFDFNNLQLPVADGAALAPVHDQQNINGLRNFNLAGFNDLPPAFANVPEGGIRLVQPEELGLRPAEIGANVEFVEEEEDQWDPDDWNGVLEVVGLVGPIHGLFQNLIFALFIMGFGIILILGVPMLIGKLFLSFDFIRTALGVSSKILIIIRKVTDPVVDIVLEIVKDVVVLPLMASGRAAEKIVAKKLGLEVGYRLGSSSGGFSRLTAGESASRLSPILEKASDYIATFGQFCYDSYNSILTFEHHIATSTSFSGRAACIATGYAFVASLVTLTAIAGKARLTRTATEFAETLNQHSNFVKVAFFMTLELVAFPLCVGGMIDLCLVPLFPGATILSRWENLVCSPFGTAFIDWLVGSMFMFSFSTLLGQVRKVTRPGTMFFVRDPGDPNFSPVKDIVDKTTLHQLRKLGSSVIMYSAVVFSLFGVVSWGLAYVPGGFLPLKVEPTFGPITSVPFDLLFLHLAIPPTIDLVRPQSRARRLFIQWWRAVTTRYRLTNLVAPVPNENERSEAPTKLENALWPICDWICQKLFGKYRTEATDARVPASDSVVLMPIEQRRKEGGVFVPLDESGIPYNRADKLRLLKQDKIAREAGRLPTSDYTVVWLPKYWRTRIHMFVASALASMSIVIALAVFMPLAVGRMMWKTLGMDVHDGYSWFAGAYILYFSLTLGRRARKYITNLNRAERLRASVFSKRVKRGVLRWIAGIYGVITFYAFVPALVGMVIDVYLGGLWSSRNNVGRVIHVWDAWAMGTAFCSVIVGVVGLLPRARRTGLHNVCERFREPAAKDFKSTTRLARLVLIPSVILLVAPHVVGTTLIELLPESANQEENNAILFRSVVIPLMLVLSIAYATSRYLESEASVIRQKVIEAEYVVEERVENYVPPANDGGQSGKLGSGGAGPGSIGGNAEKVAVNGEGDDDWEDM